MEDFDIDDIPSPDDTSKPIKFDDNDDRYREKKPESDGKSIKIINYYIYKLNL